MGVPPYLVQQLDCEGVGAAEGDSLHPILARSWNTPLPQAWRGTCMRIDKVWWQREMKSNKKDMGVMVWNAQVNFLSFSIYQIQNHKGNVHSQWSCIYMYVVFCRIHLRCVKKNFLRNICYKAAKIQVSYLGKWLRSKSFFSWGIFSFSARNLSRSCFRRVWKTALRNVRPKMAVVSWWGSESHNCGT